VICHLNFIQCKETSNDVGPTSLTELILLSSAIYFAINLSLPLLNLTDLQFLHLRVANLGHFYFHFSNKFILCYLLFSDRVVEAKEKDPAKAAYMAEDLEIPEIQKTVL